MKLFASVILGVSAIISAALIGNGLTDLRTGDRYVTVKGVAEREVNADLALWPIRFVATGASRSEAQERARSSRDAIMAFLKLQAIDQNAVELQRLDVTDTRANPYQANNGEQKFIISQTPLAKSWPNGCRAWPRAKPWWSWPTRNAAPATTWTNVNPKRR